MAALAAATQRWDATAAARAARRLVGYGPGLTPAGDDLLAGLLAAVRLLGAALGTAALTARFADELGAEVRSLAPVGTTALSATLLDHGSRGEVARPPAALLLALAGHGAVPPAARALLAVGHTSGTDLAGGIAIATRAVLAEAAGRRGSPSAAAATRRTG